MVGENRRCPHRLGRRTESVSWRSLEEFSKAALTSPHSPLIHALGPAADIPVVGNIAPEQAALAQEREAKSFRYVARQPIFDRYEKVFGYELLFRDGLENAFSGDADEASCATLDRSLLMGLDVLCDGRRAFVNCTRNTLIKGLVTLLPSTSTVVEVLESVPPDAEVMTACQSLKEAGYMIALDDFVAGDHREPLVEIADVIKVEMQLTTEAQRQQLVRRFGPWRCRMLR